MLTELSGTGPVLLALTGTDDGRTLGKINWRKVRKAAAWTLAPGAMAAIKAAKATKAALERKRKANIERLKIERANRARKLAEAQKRQADAEQAARIARTAEDKARAEEMRQTALQAQEEISATPEVQYEEVTETPDAPAEEMETIEEGTDEGAEVMGYARSNDDYFVGVNPAPLKKVPAKSGQIQIVKTRGPAKKTLFIIGGVVIGAYLFRKQIKKAFKG